MKPPRFACLFVIFISAMLLAQSNSVPLFNQSAKVVPLGATSAPDPKAQAKILDSYGKLPLSFEANKGQTDARVKFFSRTSGYTLFLTGDEAVLTLSGGKTNANKAKIGSATPMPQTSMVQPKAGGVLRMKLRNANPAVKVTGAEELPGKSNYFIGNDPKKWHSGVSTYAKVKYKEVYSGIDLVYYGNQRQLEYNFVVAPGADPRRIAFDVRGAKRIRREEHGALVFKMDDGEIRWRRPVVYQERNGLRQQIPAHYVIKDANRVAFALAKYDTSKPLYIDPLMYSTYLGGNGGDYGYGIAADTAGNAYIVGQTYSQDFPTMNPFQPANGGIGNAFVTKINPAGSALIYSTYLGGNSQVRYYYDGGDGVAVDSSGNAFVTGWATSADFPVTPGAFQTTCYSCQNGLASAFVTALDPSGSTLVYSTYLGGSAYNQGSGIAVNSSGNAYVLGSTASTDFPVTPGAFQITCACEYDAFVTEFNPSGSALVYSTYLGGSAYNNGQGIALDSSGNAYVTGYTESTNFPTTPGALQTSCGSNCGNNFGFVTKINSAGSALAYSTYLGGSVGGISTGIAVDSSGDAYVTGSTGSGFPTTAGAFQTTYGGGGEDAFVCKINPAGSTLVYSTYLGGNASDTAYGIAADGLGNAYVAGWTFSANFPVTPGAFQTACGGGCLHTNAFVSEINPTGSALVYSTFLGGSGNLDGAGDSSAGVAVDGSGNAYVAGTTNSTDFPVTPGAFQTTCGGGCGASDAFVTKLPTNPIAAFSPTSLTFPDQTIFTTSAAKPVTLTNTGLGILLINKIRVTGSFTQTNNCGKSVKPGAKCTINVKFDPKTKGVLHGTLSVTDNAPDSPQTVSLTGTGTYVELSPTSLNFGTQPVGTKSLPKTVTLTNKGSVAVSISGISITGTDLGDFSETNTCGKSVAAGASCFIKVIFKPLVKGKRTADVSISDNGGGSPQKATLTGTGT